MIRLLPSSASSKRRIPAVLVGLALIAAACGSEAASVTASEPISTNDGNISISPPDVLAGNPEEPPVPLRDLPPPVEGLEPTPAVLFDYFDGTPATTAQFLGTPTVLNFWASNCAACVSEMPEFETVFQSFGGDVNFVGMNVTDVSRESAVRLAEQTGVTYRLGDDTEANVFRAFGGFVMPTTVFLNEQGQVAFSWAGVLNEDELTRLINEHILPES